MSNKVQPILPKDNNYYGVWVPLSEDSDVHVYVAGSEGVVIGFNPVHDKLKFTNPALVFDKEGIRLQYADTNGNPAIKDVPLEVVSNALLTLLYSIQGHVVHHEQKD